MINFLLLWMLLTKSILLPQFIKDILLFLVLIFSFHYLYLAWTASGFFPLGEQVKQFFNYAGSALYRQSATLLDFIGFEYTTEGQTFYFLNRTGSTSWIGVDPECASLKQWLHWIFLMLLFPGPWKHKAWFIPAGLLVLQAVSVLRITGLVFTLSVFPTQFHFLHDYAFKAFFYAALFGMWMIWVEWFRK